MCFLSRGEQQKKYLRCDKWILLSYLWLDEYCVQFIDHRTLGLQEAIKNESGMIVNLLSFSSFSLLTRNPMKQRRSHKFIILWLSYKKTISSERNWWIIIFHWNMMLNSLFMHTIKRWWSRYNSFKASGNFSRRWKFFEI